MESAGINVLILTSPTTAAAALGTDSSGLGTTCPVSILTELVTI